MQSKKHGHACKEGENSVSFTNVLLIPQGMSVCIGLSAIKTEQSKF